MRLLAKRMPIAVQKRRLDVLSRQVTGFLDRQSRFLLLMEEENLRGRTDPDKWNVIQHTFNFESERIAAGTAEQTALERAIYAAQVVLMQETLEEVWRVTELVAPAIASARRELDLPIDVAAFQTILTSGIREQQQQVAEFVRAAQAINSSPESTGVRPPEAPI
jgi:hypothetical protein